MVLVAVWAFHFAGLDLTEPCDVIVLGVHAPPWVVRANEQRILLGTLGPDGLLVADALGDPFRYRRSFEIFLKVLLKPRGQKLELAGRSGKRGFFGTLVEVVEARGHIFPSVGGRNHQVALLIQIFPADEVGATGGLPAIF